MSGLFKILFFVSDVALLNISVFAAFYYYDNSFWTVDYVGFIYLVVFSNLAWHHTCKNGIATILCGGRQNTVEIVFFFYFVQLRYNGFKYLPLVPPEIVEQKKNNWLLIIEMW